MPRVIAKIVIESENAYSTKHMKPYKYLGDPINVASILSEFGCDEILIVNLSKTIPWHILNGIAWGVGVPLSYGGNTDTILEVNKIISMGYEKIVLKSDKFSSGLAAQIVSEYGKQAVTCSLQTKKLSLAEMQKVINCMQNTCGEIILTRTSVDGARNHLEDLSSFSFVSAIPLVLTCGIGEAETVDTAFRRGFDGVAIGTDFSLNNKDFAIAHIDKEYQKVMECNQ